MNIRMEPCVSGAKRHPRTISNSRRANFKRLALWTGTFGTFRCKSAFRQGRIVAAVVIPKLVDKSRN
jgi:hypothetical protein